MADKLGPLAALMREKRIADTYNISDETEKNRALELVPKTVPVPEAPLVPETEPVPQKPLVPKTPPPQNATSAPPQNATRPLEKGLVPKAVLVPFELPVNAPHFRYPYEVLEGIMDTLKPGPARVLEKLYRLSAGFYKDECLISLPRLARSINADEKAIRRYLTELEEKGFITRLRDDKENRNIDLRGVHFRVNLPRMPRPQKGTSASFATSPQNAPHKSNNTYKEKEIKSEIVVTAEEKEAYKTIHGREWKEK